MGLPVSQRRILERIENALLGSDPRLAALFSIFTRLNRDEEMPRVEEIRARAAIILARVWFRIAAFGRWLGAPRRAKLRAALFFPVALAIVATAVLVGGSFPNNGRCAVAQRTQDTTQSSAGARPRLCEPVVANPAILGR
jgi:hypothetical protein